SGRGQAPILSRRVGATDAPGAMAAPQEGRHSLASVDVADFDYDLPPERIAQQPLPERDAARLLVDGGPARAPTHRTVRDLPSLLRAGDVLVVNHTEVLPARLRLVKAT